MKKERKTRIRTYNDVINCITSSERVGVVLVSIQYGIFAAAYKVKYKYYCISYYFPAKKNIFECAFDRTAGRYTPIDRTTVKQFIFDYYRK